MPSQGSQENLNLQTPELQQCRGRSCPGLPDTQEQGLVSFTLADVINVRQPAPQGLSLPVSSFSSFFFFLFFGGGGVPNMVQWK